MTGNEHASRLFPQTPADKAILRARANDLAQATIVAPSEQPRAYLRFRLGASCLYGVPYDLLEEVIATPDISPIPCTPRHIAGVTNYRGELITLLDLAEIFGIKRDASQSSRMLIVVQTNKVCAGLIVDDIEGNDEYTASSLSPGLPGSQGRQQDYVMGIHQGRITLLDIRTLLADPALQVDETIT